MYLREIKDFQTSLYAQPAFCFIANWRKRTLMSGDQLPDHPLHYSATSAACELKSCLVT